MRFWRICRKCYATEAAAGEGARLANWLSSRDESLRKIGDVWVRDRLTVALLVPSAAIRGEWNLLLNPAHRDFSKINIEEPQPFEFDLRMFR